MKVTPLGGAQEIGASCYLAEIDKKRILIDCGTRVIRELAASTSPFPDINDVERVDAICITHAHLDHVGALPLAMRKFKNAYGFMSIPTFPLAVTMMMDVVRRVEKDFLLFHLPEWFTENTIDRLADRVLTVKYFQQFRPFVDSSLAITFEPAGHILGASGIRIDGEEGSILFTGDYTPTPQRTVSGSNFSEHALHMLVTETTYGDRVFQKREEEEKKLIETIRDTIQAGGKVLIPTFALGRAQEVILLIQEAQASNALPPAPIFIDGLVRSMCNYYEAMKQPGIFSLYAEPFKVLRVRNQHDRHAALNGDPCVIVSSSGQLVGGPSVRYATELLPNEKNAIILVSYQDEESPGWRLNRLQPGDSLFLGDNRVKIAARITHAHLSAHADANQLTELALRLQPRNVVCVHGMKEAGEELRKRLNAQSFKGRVFVPRNGETISC